MSTELYLDTARLGRMCRGARLAEQDFGRLVGRLGSSLYLEQFLADGFRSLPNTVNTDEIDTALTIMDQALREAMK